MIGFGDKLCGMLCSRKMVLLVVIGMLLCLLVKCSYVDLCRIMWKFVFVWLVVDVC